MVGWKVFTLCVYVFLSVGIKHFGDALKQSERGVCVETVLQDSDKPLYKKVNTRCGNKICTKRISYKQKVKVKVPVCCVGWEWNKLNDTCQPICAQGCTNGTCIAPEWCECKSPLILVDHACVNPVCAPACFNADCVQTNFCNCHYGFSPYNDTHCVPDCAPGFRLEGFECKPVCIGCSNGECVAPNTCKCSSGFGLVDEECEPICKTECENADCVAPDECRCHEGYERYSTSSCKPICNSCDNGDCIAPNNCICNDGYSMKDGICSPVCAKNCTNGVCSSPETCSCDPGYHIKEDKYYCEPKCDPECINATCSLPNNCVCLAGYHKTNDLNICAPTCDRCDNGSCVAPDTCVCLPGYALINGECIAQCEKNCTNGFCSEPNTCTCHLGYSVIDQYTCQPTCDPPCINGTCVSPNLCSCYPGFEKKEDRQTCEPVCKSCKNGSCVSPDICACNKGYKLVDEGCAPVCLDPCINGECIAPNTCECKEDYINNETEPHLCFKPCAGCIMGSCDLDGRCVCEPGFALKNDSCVSIVPVECNTCNGTCESTPCWCYDGTPCYVLPETSPAQVPASLTLAGLELTWLVVGLVGLVLLVLVIVIIQRTWRQHRVTKSVDLGNPFDSVMYAAPNTLMQRKSIEEDNEDDKNEDECDPEYGSVKKYEYQDNLVNGDTCLELLPVKEAKE